MKKASIRELLIGTMGERVCDEEFDIALEEVCQQAEEKFGICGVDTVNYVISLITASALEGFTLGAKAVFDLLLGKEVQA